jgi:precorrin-6B methylase 2
VDLYYIIFYILFIALLILIWIFWSSLIGAGFEPTSKNRVDKMLAMLEIGSGDVLYDLGSGDGRIVMEAVKKYDVNAVGIEADPLRVLWSRLFIFFYGIHSKTKIKWGNFFNEDISDATAVTLFLSAKANQKLIEKFEKELKQGTLVVSYVWTFDGWIPTKVNEKDRIYLYEIGKTYF